jgi:hypothetical protein
VLLHDLGRDRKAQARAAMLGGVEGQKQPLANFVGQPVAGVGDGDLDRRAVFAERAVNAEHAQQAALHGLGGVVDQVGQRAANGLGIGQHRRQSRLQIPLHGDAFEPAGKQRQRLFDDLIHVAGARLRRGKLRQRGELIDQRAQRAHAAQNHLAALAMTLGESGWPRSRCLPMRSAESAMGVSGFLISCATAAPLPSTPVAAARAAARWCLPPPAPFPAARGQFKPRAGDGQMHGAARGMKFNLSGRRAHAVAAADHAGQIFAQSAAAAISIFSPPRRSLAPSHQRGKGAVGLQHHARAIQRDHARGNRLDDRLQLAAALFDGQVGRGQLAPSALRQLRLASRSAAMWLKERTRSPISPVATRHAMVVLARQSRPWRRPAPPPAA